MAAHQGFQYMHGSCILLLAESDGKPVWRVCKIRAMFTFDDQLFFIVSPYNAALATSETNAALQSVPAASLNLGVEFVLPVVSSSIRQCTPVRYHDEVWIVTGV